MKKYIGLLILALILTGCSSQTIATDSLSFDQKGDNYSLSKDVESETLTQLQTDLDELNLDLNQDTKVAVIATSTANIIDELGMNIVASTSSKKLNDNLKQELNDGSIIDLGSPLEPNMEQLLKTDADVVLVGSNMPHQDKYDTIDNLVVIPQKQYYDIFYSVDTLIKKFGLGEQAQTVFNQMVVNDQEAKKIAENQKIDGNAVALKYAYGNITIAPNQTYIGSLLQELNIPNLYGENKDIDVPMSKEQLLLDNPEYIIIYGKGDDMQEKISDLKTNDDLKNLQAYQDNHIIMLQSESLNADIDSAKTLLELSKDIYGEEN